MICLENLPERFRSKIGGNPDPTACWLWTASINKRSGYAYYFWGRLPNGNPDQRVAHRVAYEMLVGPIPEGKVLDHLCRVRHCVNPAHLEAVTQRENLMRGETIPARNATKTHCIHGHALTPENTIVLTTRPERVCRECNRIRCKRRYEKSMGRL